MGTQKSDKAKNLFLTTMAHALGMRATRIAARFYVIASLAAGLYGIKQPDCTESNCKSFVLAAPNYFDNDTKCRIKY
jgi:hypothetical protein